MNSEMLEQDKQAVEAKAIELVDTLGLVFNGFGFGGKFLVFGDQYYGTLLIDPEEPRVTSSSVEQMAEDLKEFLRKNLPAYLGFRAATPHAQNVVNSIHLERGEVDYIKSFCP